MIKFFYTVLNLLVGRFVLSLKRSTKNKKNKNNKLFLVTFCSLTVFINGSSLAQSNKEDNEGEQQVT